MYAEFLKSIEAARETHEDLEPATDTAALLLVEAANLLARCESIARALVADEKA